VTFVHEDPEFADLLAVVAQQRGIAVALIEKDYWVTHTLWALLEQGFELWFKGGTSLSKGFQLIQRFSEDLDLKIEPGRVPGLAPIANWKNAKPSARARYFDGLAQCCRIPNARVENESPADVGQLRVYYEGRHAQQLQLPMKPYVLLEVGDARVVPFVRCDISSFVHDYLEARAQLQEFASNRPRGVRCVHPLVTLLEKMDALQKRVPTARDAADFVRHFEDASRLVRAFQALPQLEDYESPKALAADLQSKRQIKDMPHAGHAAFNPVADDRWSEIRGAYAAIEPMFWGPRVSLEDACADIREWIKTQL
jgi:predicted nucleotidyltransferase component of viral defense system